MFETFKNLVLLYVVRGLFFGALFLIFSGELKPVVDDLRDFSGDGVSRIQSALMARR